MNLNDFSFRGGHVAGEGAPNLVNLYKTGNFRKVSGKQRFSNHIDRNRRILIISAVFIAFLGLLSIFL